MGCIISTGISFFLGKVIFLGYVYVVHIFICLSYVQHSRLLGGGRKLAVQLNKCGICNKDIQTGAVEDEVTSTAIYDILSFHVLTPRFSLIET